jgi:hypothetical protein
MSRLGTFVKEFGWLGTAAATLAAGVWAVTTYLQNAKLEYTKDFNTRQMKAIFEATATVSSLVVEMSPDEWNKHRAAFWKLHYGELVLFEGPEIECAMTYFGAKLNATDFNKRYELAPRAFAVSAALRKFVADLNSNGWNIKLANLAGVKTEVTPILGLKEDPSLSDRMASFPEVEGKIDAKCRLLKAPAKAA